VKGRSTSTRINKTFEVHGKGLLLLEDNLKHGPLSTLPLNSWKGRPQKNQT